jgi:hypothetical protein
MPCIYPLFILLLPFETPVWALLLLGFGTGLIADTYHNTAGLNACATVLIAYVRTNVLTALLPRHLSEYARLSPSIKTMTWPPFLSYCSFLILLHQLTFFALELWNLHNIGYLALKTLASTITSMLFVLTYVLLFTRQTSMRNA